MHPQISTCFLNEMEKPISFQMQSKRRLLFNGIEIFCNCMLRVYTHAVIESKCKLDTIVHKTCGL